MRSFGLSLRHGCRSEVGADRALVDAWSSSGASVCSVTIETLAPARSSSVTGLGRAF
jgi:hypothetical protein